MSYQTSSKQSQPFWLLIGARKRLCFSGQPEARMAATIWNWSGKTLSPGALLAVLYFSSCHIFPPVQTFPRPHYLPLGLRGWYPVSRGFFSCMALVYIQSHLSRLSVMQLICFMCPREEKKKKKLDSDRQAT